MDVKAPLSDAVKRAIAWQNNEVSLAQANCIELVQSQLFRSASERPVSQSIGVLLVTNQRILYVCKTGLLSQNYCLNYALNLEDVVSVSLGKMGIVNRLIILDKANQRKEFSDVAALRRNVHNLIPIINLAVSERKSQIKVPSVQSEESHADVPVREIIKEKEVIVKIRCPYCKQTYPETLDKCPNCGAG
jgi:hypothetical protein